MDASSLECLRASENLARAIDYRLRYPGNVFREGWGSFHFFASDWIFEDAFVVKALSLLDAEGSSCACLTNLDHDLKDSPKVFSFERRTTPADYQRVLRGTSPANSLKHAIERFVCISDRGLWGIYCERQNELAVFGLRRGASSEAYKPFLDSVSARRVTDVAAGGADFGFSEHEISQEWRERLVAVYSG